MLRISQGNKNYSLVTEILNINYDHQYSCFLLIELTNDDELLKLVTATGKGANSSRITNVEIDFCIIFI